MAIDNAPPPDLTPPDEERSPEPIDWWVWGVRKVAGVFAEMLLTARLFCLLFVGFKLIVWALSGVTGELYQAAGGVAALIGFWALARLLGRFSAVREPPDLDRWLWRHRDR